MGRGLTVTLPRATDLHLPAASDRMMWMVLRIEGRARLYKSVGWLITGGAAPGTARTGARKPAGLLPPQAAHNLDAHHVLIGENAWSRVDSCIASGPEQLSEMGMVAEHAHARAGDSGAHQHHVTGVH
jgi:hypothetical protein